jgi:hypothetical protein
MKDGACRATRLQVRLAVMLNNKYPHHTARAFNTLANKRQSSINPLFSNTPNTSQPGTESPGKDPCAQMRMSPTRSVQTRFDDANASPISSLCSKSQSAPRGLFSRSCGGGTETNGTSVKRSAKSMSTSPRQKQVSMPFMPTKLSPEQLTPADFIHAVCLPPACCCVIPMHAHEYVVSGLMVL